jgi:hypothetical protein
MGMGDSELTELKETTAKLLKMLQESESIRQIAEEAREKAEAARITAEEARAIAETVRSEIFIKLKKAFEEL